MSDCVHIRLSPRPHAQLFDVHMLFPLAAASEDATVLRFPVWTPGSYLLREYARHIQGFQACSLEGQPLPFERLSKNRLRVHNRGEAFSVAYSLWAAELCLRSNHLDDSHGFLNGAASFFFSTNSRALPHALRLCCPQGWLSACALPQADGAYVAQNFDELVDSPVEMGPHAQPFCFLVDNVPHQLVWWGRPPPDMDALLRGLHTVCSAQVRFFGSLPLQRYLFIVHAPDKGHGGLEHRASTALLFGQENLAQEHGLENFLCLAAHEYFHLWNVKRMAPPALVQPDYEKECYTRMLWAFEGGTCYYEKLLNFRAGLLPEARLLRLLGDTLSELASTPGRLHMSLEESSLLAWTHLYRPHANSRNTHVSYYVKGEVVCLLLDLLIRQLTDNHKSLDDVFRLLWQRVQQGETLSENAFEAAAVQTACAPLDAFFNHALRSTEPLDFSPLQHVGLEVCFKKRRLAENKPPPKRCLGMYVQENSHRVSYVHPEGAAFLAGIHPGDEILALDGHKFSLALLPGLLEASQGSPLTLLFARRGRLCQTHICPLPAPDDACALRYVDSPSPAQQRALQGWLKGECRAR